MKTRTGLLGIILMLLSAGPGLAGHIGQRTFVLDGNINDWTNSAGFKFLSDNTAGVKSNQYVWQDAYNDDKGDGDYVYPYTNWFGANSADIDQFRVSWDANYLYLMVRMHNGTGEWWASAFFVGIDTGTPASGMRLFIEGDGTTASNGPSIELRCGNPRIDYLLFCTSKERARLWNSAGTYIGDGSFGASDGTKNNIYCLANAWNEYEVAIPRALIGGAVPTNSTWRFIAGSSFELNGMSREIQPDNGGVPIQDWPIHGDDNWWDNRGVDPDVFDLIGASQADQESDLNSYTKNASPNETNSFATITYSYVTVGDYNKFFLQPSSVNAKGGETVPLTIRGYNTMSTGSFLNTGYTAAVFSNIGRMVGTNFYATNITKATARGFIAFTMPGVSAYTLRVTLTSNITAPATNIVPEEPAPVPFSVEVSPSYLAPADEKLTITVGVSASARVECFIYSLNGTLVRKIEKQLTRSNNSFDWDRKGDSGKKAGSGLYLIKIKTGNNTVTKKVLLAN